MNLKQVIKNAYNRPKETLKQYRSCARLISKRFGNLTKYLIGGLAILPSAAIGSLKYLKKENRSRSVKQYNEINDGTKNYSKITNNNLLELSKFSKPNDLVDCLTSGKPVEFYSDTKKTEQMIDYFNKLR